MPSVPPWLSGPYHTSRFTCWLTSTHVLMVMQIRAIGLSFRWIYFVEREGLYQISHCILPVSVTHLPTVKTSRVIDLILVCSLSSKHVGAFPHFMNIFCFIHHAYLSDKKDLNHRSGPPPIVIVWKMGWAVDFTCPHSIILCAASLLQNP